MRGFLTLFKKDLKGFFVNPVFYLVTCLCTIVLSFTFSNQLAHFNNMSRNAMFQPGMSGPQMNIHFGLFWSQFQVLNLLMILIVPALTMRLLSEEKKNRTFDLLLTSPISSLQIVLGKYAAALVAVFAIVFLAFCYCAWTGFFANFSWPLLIVAYLALFLMGAVYAAMDIFCSALTESALGAFVMAIIFNISILLIGQGAENTDSQLVRQFFEHISLGSHVSALFYGTLRTSSMVFLASVIGLNVFMAERVIEANRWR